MAEQRQVRRHPETTLRVSFDAPGSGRISAPVWDASLGGLFIETEHPLADAALLSLELHTADTNVAVDARVLWSRPTKRADDEPAGMAVRFIDLPDDVSVALNRALQGGLHDKTILGIGGVSKEPTQIGIAAPPVASAPTPRETQIGVAPPANAAVGKPRLVVSETSLPDVPAPAETPPPSNAVDPSRLEETTPSRTRFSSAEAGRRSSGSVGGRLLLAMLVGAGAAGAYLYRDKLVELAVPPAPSAAQTPAPTAHPSATATTDVTADAQAATPLADASLAALPTADGTDAGNVSSDAGITDAGSRDAGPRDAGHGDAGHTAGHADAGHADAGKGAAPKTTPRHP